MKDMFPMWWAGQPEFMDGHADPQFHKAARDYAAASWNDGRQTLLMQIVLKVTNIRKILLKEMNELPAGSAERAGLASAVTALGKLVVEISETEV